jgi:hypothetical protein
MQTQESSNPISSREYGDDREGDREAEGVPASDPCRIRGAVTEVKHCGLSLPGRSWPNRAGFRLTATKREAVNWINHVFNARCWCYRLVPTGCSGNGHGLCRQCRGKSGVGGCDERSELNGRDGKPECRVASLRHWRGLARQARQGRLQGHEGQQSPDVGETRVHHGVIGMTLMRSETLLYC